MAAALVKIGASNSVFRVGAAENSTADNIEQLSLIAHEILPVVRGHTSRERHTVDREGVQA
jgi:hypothetical protein